MAVLKQDSVDSVFAYDINDVQTIRHMIKSQIGSYPTGLSDKIMREINKITPMRVYSFPRTDLTYKHSHVVSKYTDAKIELLTTTMNNLHEIAVDDRAPLFILLDNTTQRMADEFVKAHERDGYNVYATPPAIKISQPNTTSYNICVQSYFYTEETLR